MHLGKPILARNGDFIHLAHRLPSGLQWSVENFLSFMEGVDYCKRHDIDAWVCFKDYGCRVTQIDLIMAAGLSGTAFRNVAADLGVSVSSIKLRARSLARQGFVEIDKPKGTYALTESGLAVYHELGAMS